MFTYCVGLSVLACLSLAHWGTALSQEAKDTKDVKYRKDKFNGAQYWETKLWGRSVWDGSGTDLKARKVLLDNGAISYLLLVERQEHEWAFFRGPSEWLFDGRRVSVGKEDDGTEGSKNNIVTDKTTGVWVQEKAFYTDVDPQFFRELAGASQAEVRLRGERDSYTKELGKKELQRAKTFYETVVAPDGAPHQLSQSQLSPDLTRKSSVPTRPPVEQPLPPPPGAKYVADPKQKVYAPVTCHDALVRMDPDGRYYYQTEAAAKADGYERAAGCPLANGQSP